MILNRYRQFVDSQTLAAINHELIHASQWIWRTNFWRYYLVPGLQPYNEKDTQTWYHSQGIMHKLSQPWLTLFEQVIELAGPNFRIQRYALTGQTQAQHQTLHYDVSPELPGTHRSFLFYLNHKWDQQQGGATDFVANDQLAHQEWPEPGKLIEFDSQTLHCGHPPDVPNLLRLTMVIHGQLI